MKLMTNIPARRDGTVTLFGLDGQTHVFRADAAGDLTCDIDHKETIAQALSNGFYPADPADYDAAVAIAGEQDDAADEDMDAAPIEAASTPAPRKRGRKAEA